MRWGGGGERQIQTRKHCWVQLAAAWSLRVVFTQHTSEKPAPPHQQSLEWRKADAPRRKQKIKWWPTKFAWRWGGSRLAASGALSLATVSTREVKYLDTAAVRRWPALFLNGSAYFCATSASESGASLAVIDTRGLAPCLRAPVACLTACSIETTRSPG